MSKKRRKKTKTQHVATVLKKDGSFGIRFPDAVYNAVKK